MLFGTLDATLLGNLLIGKGAKTSSTPRHNANIPWRGVLRAGEGTNKACEGTNRAGEGVIRTGQDFQCKFLKYKNIIKTNMNLIVFIQETIYLK